MVSVVLILILGTGLGLLLLVGFIQALVSALMRSMMTREAREGPHRAYIRCAVALSLHSKQKTLQAK